MTVEELMKKWRKVWPKAWIPYDASGESGYVMLLGGGRSVGASSVDELDVLLAALEDTARLDALDAALHKRLAEREREEHIPTAAEALPMSLAEKCREAGFVCKTTGYECAGGAMYRSLVKALLADYFERQEPAPKLTPEPVPLTDDCILIDGATVSMPRLVRLWRAIQWIEARAAADGCPKWRLSDGNDILCDTPEGAECDARNSILAALEHAFGEGIA